MPTVKLNLGSLFLVAVTFFCATGLSYAQAIGPAVEAPTTHNGDPNSPLIEIPSAQQNVTDSSSASNVTMAGEYKSTKEVIEQEKPVFWAWAADVGYESQYNFRGTNLTPGADGAVFVDAEVSKWNFTLGVYNVYQLSTAHATSWSIGEGGGGGSQLALFGKDVTFTPTTTQSRFDEVDLFLQYHLALGPVDLTFGNVAFFIDRRAETVLALRFFGTKLFPPVHVGTVGGEQFDRLFLRLSTSRIPYITPSITYYQTILNSGEDAQVFDLSGGPLHRNDELGGYLEGKLRGNFTITKWLNFNPYGVISYSFHDRTEPIANATTFRDAVRGRSLVGFNAAQVGAELPARLLHTVGHSTGPYAPPDINLYLVPFVWYSYHISDPTPGTERNEWWGGAKFTLTF